MTWRTRPWLVFGPLALAAGAGALVLVVASDHESNVVRTLALGLFAGWSFVASGLIAWERRPANSTGRLLVATGFAFFLGALWESNDSIPFTIGVLLNPLPILILVHLLVAYPTGELVSRLERAVVACAYAAGAVFSPVTLLFDDDPAVGCDNCPANAFLVADRPGLNHAIQQIVSVLAVALVLAVIVAIVRRWRSASPAARRSMRLVFFAGGLTMALFAVQFAVDPFSHDLAQAVNVGAFFGFMSVPLFFLLGLLHSRIANVGVGRLVVELGRTSEPGAVRDALAEALHDPTLELAYRLPETGAWVDAGGRFFEFRRDDPERATTFVEHDGEPIAALVHDPAARRDEPLFEAAVATARLAIENERLQADLRSRIADLERERDFTRLVVDSTPAIFCVVDPDGGIVRFNRALEELTGLEDGDDVKGRLFWDVFAVEEQAEASRLALAGAATGLPAEPRVALVPTPAGEHRLVEWIDVPIPDPSGELRFILRAGLDITERHRAAEKLRTLAESQAALRRVATVVASNPSEKELLDAVTSEVGALFSAQTANMVRYEAEDAITVMGGWSLPGERSAEIGSVLTLDGDTSTARVKRTGKPARIDDYEDIAGELAATLRELGIRSSIAAPIVVGGRLWGAITVSMTRGDDHFPPGAEERLAAFTALVAQAIENAESRDEIRRLAEEQAALRRVATIVASEPSPEDVLESVTTEVGLLLEAQSANITRHEADVVRVVGSWSAPGARSIAPGTAFPFSGDTATARALATQGPSRVDSPDDVRSDAGRAVWGQLGIRSSIAAPIVVEGELWGAISASKTTDERFPEGAEDRLGDFAALVAQAIANAVSRDEVRRLAEEQAALRRVATLVATGPTEEELLEVVTSEIGQLFDGQSATMERLEGETLRVMGGWSLPGTLSVETGTVFPLEADSTTGRALRSGRPERIDSPDEVRDDLVRELWRKGGVQSTIAAPIVVNGRVWGVISVSKTTDERFPDLAEERLADFAALAAQAVGNAEARDQVRRLAAEQAALRRVATVVASEPSPDDVLAAVTSEVGRLFKAQVAQLWRIDGDSFRAVSGWHSEGETFVPVGKTHPADHLSPVGRVVEERAPIRVDSYDDFPGPVGEQVRAAGVRSSIAAPIEVEGALWGAIAVSKLTDEGFREGAERRLADFAALVSQAVANAQAHEELSASRARIVQATDEARRKLERNLHDGAQQRLVSLSLTLRLVQGKLHADPDGAAGMLSGASSELAHALEELRELARGIHPAILTDRGLRPALEALVARVPLPVEIDHELDERLPEQVEAAAYYVVSESLANVAKYAQASWAHVRVGRANGLARVEVVDDGVGGADPALGSGLRGLADRVEALSGRLFVASEAGAGTRVLAEIPCP